MSALHELQRDLTATILGTTPAPDLAPWLASPISRISVYRNNTFQSLTEALRATFPVVAALVGPKFFAHAAETFIRSHPPTTPRLVVYGDRFAAFLAAWPACDCVPYLPDVARLEWQMNESIHSPRRTPTDYLGLTNLDQTAGARIMLQPSARLLVTRWSALDIWSAHQGEDLPTGFAVNRTAQFILLHRVDDRIAMLRLDNATFAFCHALTRGRSLEDAARAALRRDCLFDLLTVLLMLMREGVFITAEGGATADPKD